ncbi:type II toxin-antitoxin system VapB family antitoxin [Paraburkholderia phenoliruptrix]|uniref:type II toxin-antitoxin system VapB family antitoxin n=1 Tax=Paraburkholderia phenoliruptrix TaxID=252970 RepID=UPI003D9787A5
MENDDKLMADRLAAIGIKTEREVVEPGLKTITRLNQQEQIRLLRGNVHWEADLDEMRTDRLCPG